MSLPNIDDLARRYLAGESAQAIANSLGICSHIVKTWLKKQGVRLRDRTEVARVLRTRTDLNTEEIVRRYKAGETEQSIAASLSVARGAIRSRLLQAGIKPRSMSEACTLRSSRMSKTDRLRFTNAAHAAVRGRPQSEEHRCNIARSIERKGNVISPNERALAGWLRGLGIEVVPLKAVGRYNVDVALTESRIAVEIFGGNWHSGGSHARRFRPRINYLLDRGWVPVIVWVTTSHPLRYRVAENIITLHKSIRRDESLRGQEHVFRGDGYIASVRQTNPNNGSIKLGFNPGNPHRGKDGRFR